MSSLLYDTHTVELHTYDPVKRKWSQRATVLRLDKKPFAKGAMRGAYHCLDMTKEEDERHYVAKFSLDANEPKETYFSDVETQSVAQMYAKLYNETISTASNPKKVAFLDTHVVVFSTPVNGHKYCAIEKYIQGEYVKHSNNYGAVSGDRNTPQAFSHFSYEKSGGKLIVVDIQGVNDIYTDPQIHTVDGQVSCFLNILIIN